MCHTTKDNAKGEVRVSMSRLQPIAASVTLVNDFTPVLLTLRYSLLMAAALMNYRQVYWIFGVYWILNIIIFILFSSIASALALSTAVSESVVVPKSRILLKGIDASQFRHPLDRDLTSFVRGVPLSFLAENAIRSALSIAEQVTRLDLLSSSVKVSPQQMPELHKAMEDASKLLDMSVAPELYVQSSGQANAFTLAFQNTENKAPIVVVTSGLLDRCTNDEIEAMKWGPLTKLRGRKKRGEK
jgi:hypothetical protein